MLIECKIKRVGMTTVNKSGGGHYIFHPIPDENRTAGEPSTSYAEISEGKDLDRLLKSGQYRPYVPGQTKAEEAKTIKLPMGDYCFQPHKFGQSEGYRIETVAMPKKFAGRDGQWVETIKDLIPFDTESMAHVWLKGELEYKAREAQADMKTKASDNGSGNNIESLRKTLAELGEKVNPHWGITALTEKIEKAREKAA